MRLLFLFQGIMFLLSASVPGYGESEGEQYISAFCLQQQAGYLASDLLTGRETGTPGIRLAEDYIAQIFQQYGLIPLPGEKDFFIEFDLYKFGFNQDRTFLEFATSGTANRPAQRLRAQPGYHFRPFDFSAAGTWEAEVVFAGYGITAPEYNYDDYTGLDVKNKIVLVLRHEPHNDKPDPAFKGTASTEHSRFDSKARNALSHGAKGMLLVDDPVSHRQDASQDLRFPLYVDLDPQAQDPTLQAKTDTLGSSFLLTVYIAQEFIRKLLAAMNLNLDELQAALDRGVKPSAYPLPAIKANLRLERYSTPPKITARNVGGMMSGSAATYRNEWIVAGAHHDHVGTFMGKGDTIYNGADDNASGVAGLLTLVQAFSRTRPKPARSLVFITFSAEELGLFGSRALFEKNLIPSEPIKFMYNLDMIGRNTGQPVYLYQVHNKIEDLEILIKNANGDIGLNWQLSAPPDRYLSDYWPFSQRNIPVLFVFTGDHADYHQVSDHAGKLDYERMEKISLLSFRILEQLANPSR